MKTIFTTSGDILSHAADLCEVILVVFAIVDRVREIKKDRQGSTKD